MPGWRIRHACLECRLRAMDIEVKGNIDSGMFRAMQLAAATTLEAGKTGMTTTQIT